MALKAACKMSHKAQVSNGEASGGGINDNIIHTNSDGNNNKNRFLQQAQDSAIAVPTRNLATIVKPNQDPQLRRSQLPVKADSSPFTEKEIKELEGVRHGIVIVIFIVGCAEAE